MENKLSHMGKDNRPSMVDVSDKATSYRQAVAEGFISLNDQTINQICDNTIKKGNVLVTAELAGVQAAKRCSDMIPLCHPLMLTKVDVKAELIDDGVKVTGLVKCTGQTGVEMEALMAVSTALLTVYDMCKAVDKNMIISEVKLLEKTKKEVGK